MAFLLLHNYTDFIPVQSLIYYFILCSIMIFASDFFSNFLLKLIVSVVIACLGEIVLSTAVKLYQKA